jgi:hypothetical protein
MSTSIVFTTYPIIIYDKLKDNSGEGFYSMVEKGAVDHEIGREIPLKFALSQKDPVGTAKLTESLKAVLTITKEMQNKALYASAEVFNQAFKVNLVGQPKFERRTMNGKKVLVATRIDIDHIAMSPRSFEFCDTKTTKDEYLKGDKPNG